MNLNVMCEENKEKSNYTKSVQILLVVSISVQKRYSL